MFTWQKLAANFEFEENVLNKGAFIMIALRLFVYNLVIKLNSNCLKDYKKWYWDV